MATHDPITTDISADAELIALETRRGALAEAWLTNEDQLDAALDAGADTAEIARLRADEDRIATAEMEAECAMFGLPATTAAGRAAKAAIVERVALPRLVEAGETYAEAALRSLLADLAA